MSPSLPVIHALYENPDWLPPLVGALEAEGFTVRAHEIWHGVIEAAQAPEAGIWLN